MLDCRACHIWLLHVMNADGTGTRALTGGQANDQVPQWSPDGASILFFSDRSGKNQIHVMDAIGQNPRLLTRDTTVAAYAASWSPDGARIAFIAQRGDSTAIETMNADGSARARLPGTAGAGGVPAWSPDGRRIAFQAATGRRNDIVVMNLDGSGRARLTRGFEGRLR